MRGSPLKHPSFALTIFIHLHLKIYIKFERAFTSTTPFPRFPSLADTSDTSDTAAHRSPNRRVNIRCIRGRVLPHSAASIRENAECQSDRADNGARVRVQLLPTLLEATNSLRTRIALYSDSKRSSIASESGKSSGVSISRETPS